MSDQKPEIQPEIESLFIHCHDDDIYPHEQGDSEDRRFVRYDDCLRAVTLAKIEVLEEMNKNLTYKSLGNAIVDKLIALRKEIG